MKIFGSIITEEEIKDTLYERTENIRIEKQSRNSRAINDNVIKRNEQSKQLEDKLKQTEKSEL